MGMNVGVVADLGAVLLGVVGALICIRLSCCLPMFRSKHGVPLKSRTCNTMLVFGSGGHTTEMIMLVRKLSAAKFHPVHCLIAQSDTTSKAKVMTAQISFADDVVWHEIYRSREVKQSWFTTVFTTLISLLHSLVLVLKIRPQLIICNGPGTCVPLCAAAFLYKILGLMNTQIVFVESFCRVQHMSLTGRLLYYIADRFIVQWAPLLDNYPRAEMLGDL